MKSVIIQQNIKLILIGTFIQINIMNLFVKYVTNRIKAEVAYGNISSNVWMKKIKKE